MSGVKGRSGKVTTPEQHRKRVEIASMGGNAKAGRTKIDEKPDLPLSSSDSISDEQLLQLLPGKNPYDRVVLVAKGRFTYLDGKTREQVNGEQLSNQRKQLEIDKEAGSLITQEDVETESERREAIWCAALQSVLDLVPLLVSPEAIQGARMKAAAWIEEKLSAVADEISTP